MPVYLTPRRSATDRRMDEAWEAVTPRAAGRTPGRSDGQGPAGAGAARGRRCGAFQLCRSLRESRSARGTIWRSPRAIDTIFIDHVPVLAEGRRNEAKRFILLIDTLYDHHARLVVSADAPPGELYAGKRGVRSLRVRAHRLAADRDAEPRLAGRWAAGRGTPQLAQTRSARSNVQHEKLGMFRKTG